MNDNKFKTLVKKMDKIISNPLKLERGMNVEQLSRDQLMMAHARLHNMYPAGTKEINKEDIKNLHLKVKKRMNTHSDFDHLDRE